MAAPTFVSATASAINTGTTPKDIVSISVQSGDIVTCSAFAENGTGGGTIVPTTTAGSTSAWTKKAEQLTLTAAGSGASYSAIWSATATATGTITVRCTKSAGTILWGHVVKVWRGSAGISAVGSNNNTNGIPTVNITTTGTNSGIDFVNSDWNAVQGSFAFSASNGTPVQDFADQSNNLNYCVYASHVVDAGSAGAKTMGMSLPTPQGFVVAAVEILGTGVATGPVPPLIIPRSLAMQRQKPWLRQMPPTGTIAALVPTDVSVDQVGVLRISVPAQDASPVDYAGMITVGGGSNRALLATVAFFGVGASTPTGITATWDQGGTNQSMTLLGSQVSTASGYVYCFFGLLAPTSGNKTLRVAWTGGQSTAQTGISGISFTNVNQASLSAAFPGFTTNSGTSVTASVDVPSAAGHIPVAMTAVHFTVFPLSAPSDTVLFTDNNSNNCNGEQYALAPAATENFNWTLNTSAAWTAMGIDVAPPSTITSYTMPAGLGTLTLAGQAAKPEWGHVVSAGLGTLTLTGQTVTLRYGLSYILPITTGTLTASGQTVTLAYARKVPHTQGTLTAAGQTVTLKRSRVMPVTAGTLTLSGQTAVTRYGHVVAAGLGTLTIAGQVAATRVARAIVASVGTITIAGQSVTLSYGLGRVLPASQGTLTASGQTVILRYGRKFPAGLGTITTAGQAVVLRYTRVPQAALSGALTFAGQTVRLARSTVVPHTAGVLTSAGQTNRLVWAHKGVSGTGTAVITGQTANLVYSGSGPKIMPADKGTVTINSQAAIASYGRVLTSTNGTLTIAGQTTTLARAYVMSASPGTVTLSGQTAALARTYSMIASPGAITLNGQVVALKYGWDFIGVGSTGGNTAAAFAVNVPPGSQAGDLMIVAVAYRIASTVSVTLPTGGEWTLVAESKTNDVTANLTTSTASGFMAYCVRGASLPNMTFTLPVAPSVSLARCLIYRGNAATSVLDGQTAFVTATNTTNISGAGLTTTVNNDLIVSAGCGGRSSTFSDFGAVTDPATGSGTSSVATTPPVTGAWLERTDFGTATGADVTLAVADAVKGTAGATGNLTAICAAAAGHVLVAGAFRRKSAGAVGYTLTAVSGAFTLGGQAAGLKYGRVLTAVNGSVTIAGQTVGLKCSRVAAGGIGTVTLGGQAAGLRYGRVLTCVKGAFTLSGQTALLRYGHVVGVTPGTLALAGQAANLMYGAPIGVAGVKVWTGSAWVTKPVKVWTGSAWTPKPVKHWNGSAWV